MAWDFTIVTPPAAEPVTVDELRDQCRIDGLEEGALLTGYIAAARETFEHDTNRLLMPQTIRQTLYCWPTDFIEVKRAPIRSITSITYTDSDGATATLAAADYVVRVEGEVTRIYPAAYVVWPTLGDDGVITVTAEAGYDDADAVPQLHKQAIALLAAQWFATREAINIGNIVTPVPNAYEALAARQRVQFL